MNRLVIIFIVVLALCLNLGYSLSLRSAEHAPATALLPTDPNSIAALTIAQDTQINTNTKTLAALWNIITNYYNKLVALNNNQLRITQRLTALESANTA